MDTYYHKVIPYGHCATICSHNRMIWIAYYNGPECTDKQAVNIEYWQDNCQINKLKIAGKTGNCVLIPSRKEDVKLIFSSFTDKVDEEGNSPLHPVDRWMYCINSLASLKYDENIILNRAKTIRTNPIIGYLTRCQAIRVGTEYLLPMYREYNCHGIIMASENTETWKKVGTIGICENVCNGRFGSGILMQPTIWHDGEVLRCLCRDVSRSERAWYAQSKNYGRTWSKPISSGVSNYNNSIIAIHDNSRTPWMVWNLGTNRKCLVLGQWNQEKLYATPYLQLNISGNASYPNYCWDHLDNLQIVHSDSGPIARHILSRNDLEEIKRKSITENRIIQLHEVSNIHND